MEALLSNKLIRSFVDCYSHPQQNRAIKAALIFGIQTIRANSGHPAIPIETLEAMISRSTSLPHYLLFP